ncbi:MAG: type VI secretion system contractile sheath large subunit [Haliea sp.]|nr:type VI secretion system contractile sheath large subunit [Haliea sp.]
MAATLSFEFRRSGAPERNPDLCRRLLILGDFSASSRDPSSDPALLATRPTVQIDVTTIDRVLARYSPRIRLELPGLPNAEITITQLDDLHPDALCQAYPPLSHALEADGAAVDTDRNPTADGETDDSNAAPDLPFADEEMGATLGRLLGATPSPRPSAAARAVDAFIRQVLPNTASIPASRKLEKNMLAEQHASAATILRGVLHNPDFRNVEATWRGLQFLLTRIDADPPIEIHLLDVSLAELRAQATDCLDESGRSPLAVRLQTLTDDSGGHNADWIAAVGLYDFGADDLDSLRSIAIAAQSAGMPFVGGADETLCGSVSRNGDWIAPADSTLASLQRLLNEPLRGILEVGSPRLLLRLPYGPNTDPIESFAFQELTNPVPQEEDLLWGSAALAPFDWCCHW